MEFKDVVSLIYETKDKELLGDFLTGLTTSKERRELAMRVEIIQQLLAGIPQQKIAQDLGVGIATVTRGSKELADGKFKVLRERYGK